MQLILSLAQIRRKETYFCRWDRELKSLKKNHFLLREDFQRIIDADTSEFKLCYKLKDIMVDLPHGAKMKVCFATKTFSR